MTNPVFETHTGVARLLALYQYGADTGALELVANLFTPDASYKTDNRSYVGPAGVLKFFGSVRELFMAADFLPARHHLSTLYIEPQSDGSATTYACFQFVGRHGADHWGFYRDRVVEVDGEWKFAARRVSIDGYVAGSPIERLAAIEATL
jgi:SnoaL-like domain